MSAPTAPVDSILVFAFAGALKNLDHAALRLLELLQELRLADNPVAPVSLPTFGNAGVDRIAVPPLGRGALTIRQDAAEISGFVAKDFTVCDGLEGHLAPPAGGRVGGMEQPFTSFWKEIWTTYYY
jgi:hypothetical protein